jgi:hypothetical protein
LILPRHQRKTVGAKHVRRRSAPNVLETVTRIDGTKNAAISRGVVDETIQMNLTPSPTGVVVGGEIKAEEVQVQVVVLYLTKTTKANGSSRNLLLPLLQLLPWQ